MHGSHRRENEQWTASVRHSCDRPAGSPHAPSTKYTPAASWPVEVFTSHGLSVYRHSHSPPGAHQSGGGCIGWIRNCIQAGRATMHTRCPPAYASTDARPTGPTSKKAYPSKYGKSCVETINADLLECLREVCGSDYADHAYKYIYFLQCGITAHVTLNLNVIQ